MHGAWQPRQDTRRNDPEQRQVRDGFAINSGASQALARSYEEADATKQMGRIKINRQ
jgi:hypothetical protein